MENMIKIGTDASQAKMAIDAVTESIIRVLGAAEIYRSNEVAIKALEVLERSADFSIKDMMITNCNFTNQQPPAPKPEEPKIIWPEGMPMGHWPDDKADDAASEEDA